MAKPPCVDRRVGVVVQLTDHSLGRARRRGIDVLDDESAMVLTHLEGVWRGAESIDEVEAPFCVVGVRKNRPGQPPQRGPARAGDEPFGAASEEVAMYAVVGERLERLE